jgi:hypothetical protein
VGGSGELEFDLRYPFHFWDLGSIERMVWNYMRPKMVKRMRSYTLDMVLSRFMIL